MTDQVEFEALLSNPFPEEAEPRVAARARRPRVPWRGHRKSVTIAAVAALLLAGAGGVWAATGSSAAEYRWALVRKGNVNQTLDSYGTVKPSNSATISFAASGTVATVPVSVGRHVNTGQTLATLDGSSLAAQLDSAESTLADAQARLVTDSDAQASGASAGNTAAATSAAPAAVTSSLSPADAVRAVPIAFGPSGTGSTSAAQQAVKAAQSQLLSDQQKVDDLIAAVAADLRNGTATCTSLIATLQQLAAANHPPAPVPSASPGPAPATGGTSTPVPDAGGCTSLLNKVLADQQAVTAAQATVSSDETALNDAVTQLVAAAQAGASSGNASGTHTPSTGGSGAGSSRSGNSGFSGSSTPSSRASNGFSAASGSGSGRVGGAPVTAAQLAVDQADVDAASANVTVAAQALKETSIVSPISGTVAQVNVKPGAAVNSGTAAVTVIGPGNDQVATSIGDLDLAKIHLGSPATVIPDGSSKPLSGTVTAIGLLPISTTGGTTTSPAGGGSGGSSSATTTTSATYPVTVSLTVDGLYGGAGADVSILVKHARDVLTVPTSGLSTFGSFHTISVLTGGKAVRRVVSIGASDATLTEVTAGLKAGERIVLAQLNAPLPTSGATTGLGRRLGISGGGLPGGGLGGGGFGSGGRAGFGGARGVGGGSG